MTYFWSLLGLFCFLVLMLHGLFTIVGMKKVIPNVVKSMLSGAIKLFTRTIRGTLRGLGRLIAATFRAIVRALRR